LDERFDAGATLRLAALPADFFATVRLDGARVAAAVLTRRVFAAVAARAGDFRDVRAALLFFAFDRFVMRGISFLRLLWWASHRAGTPRDAHRHAQLCSLRLNPSKTGSREYATGRDNVRRRKRDFAMSDNRRRVICMARRTSPREETAAGRGISRWHGACHVRSDDFL
jgi:hypothetical protein